MGAQVGRRRGARGVIALSGALLVGVGAMVPAYAAPGQCARPKTCQKQDNGAAKPQKPPPDTEAPPSPLFAAPEVHADGKVDLTVSAEAGARIVLQEEGATVVTAVATGAPQQLSWTTFDGEHVYTLTATDQARNKSAAARVSVEVDATAPKVRAFRTRPGTGDDSRSRVTVTTERGALFRLLVDDKQVLRGTTASGTITKVLALPDGRHAVRIDLADEVGNESSRTRALVVRIPELSLDAELTSEVTDDVQVVEVKAPAATKGVLRVPDRAAQRFRITKGAATLSVPLSDGTYADATVTVRDQQGRSGRTVLPDITVDVSPPALTVEPDLDASAGGRLSAAVSTDDNTVVTWRLLDGDEQVQAGGDFISLGRDQTIGRDVAEGDYELEVTATDTYGRSTVKRLPVAVAADPLSTAVLLLATVAALVVLAGLVAAAVVLWRRRRTDDEGHPRRSEPADDLTHAGVAGLSLEEADADWRRRHAMLVALLEVARTGAPEEVAATADVALLPDETVYYAVDAGLTEKMTGDAGIEAVEVDRGRLVVTNQRLAFVGAAQRRDWWLAMVERLGHLDERHTAISMWDSGDRSGLTYEEPEVTRLYIDLAMSARNGTGAAYVDGVKQWLRDLEIRRPSPH